MIDSKDGTNLRRTAATAMRAGGLEVVSRRATGEMILARMQDSDARGRGERISAKARELQSEYERGGNTGAKTPTDLKILDEAIEFVKSPPSGPD